jgi:hypothetical protein
LYRVPTTLFNFHLLHHLFGCCAVPCHHHSLHPKKKTFSFCNHCIIPFLYAVHIGGECKNHMYLWVVDTKLCCPQPFA